jgi:hypothetical protein
MNQSKSKASAKPNNNGRQRKSRNQSLPPKIPSRVSPQYLESKSRLVNDMLSKSVPKTQMQRSVAAAYSTGQSTFAPSILASRDMSRIVHRELIGSVVGTVNFSTNGLGPFSLNPGLSTTFPWLSTQAVGWEQYRFNKLNFCYYTRTGSNVPGSLMLIPDYDAADSAPISEQIASAYEDVSEDVPWKDIKCNLRPAAMHPDGPKKYIRTSGLASNLDIKTYDVGNLFVGTTDGTAVPWGKLWVEYDVTLYTPQLPSSGSSTSGFQSYTSGAFTSADFMSTTPTLVPSSTALYTIAGNVVTFVASGSFFVIYYATGTSITGNADPAISGSGSFISWFNATTPEGAGIDNAACFLMAVNAVVGTTLTFNNTVVGGTAAELSVIRVPSNFG